jgi:hypothetical protein
VKLPKKSNEALLASVDVEGRVQSLAFEAATALVAAGEFTPFDVADVRPGTAFGAQFEIPLVIPEDTESGDSRSFDLGSLDTRDLPLPLLWQIQTGQGHDGAVVVGRIDTIEPLAGDDGEYSGLGHARGVFDTGPYGREAERMVRDGFLRGVSADLDKFEASVSAPEDDVKELADGDEPEADEPSTDKIKNDKIRVNSARLSGVTIVAKPAFQECYIKIVDEVPEMEIPMDDGIYEEAVDDAEGVFAALAASAAPVVPPRDWFKKPNLSGPTPITVTDDGRVFGHIAAWHVDHIGLPRATKPPRSATNYAYFRTGVLRTDDGDVPVGQLTLAGGHASMHASASEAVKHYDDTASAVADVSAGEDTFGIWVAGALRPEATPEQVRALRASAPSGDWRPINGRLELVAVCQVNVPGFPVARAMVAGGQMTALVAAGARPIAELREDRVHVLEARLQELELIEFKRAKAEALTRTDTLREFVSEADTKAEAARARLSAFVSEDTEKLAAVRASAADRIKALED